MKHRIVLGICVGILLFFSKTIESVAQQEQLFVVVTASYNNAKWYKLNLESVIKQRYTNYHIIYVDDCSTDGTGDLVEKWIKQRGVEDRITLIRNTERLGAMANQYRAIQLIPDRAVVCIVDGDDWLAPHDVFSCLNRVYSQSSTWMTYGQFVQWPSRDEGWCEEIPRRYVVQNAYREYEKNLSHLRTFYAGLFKQIQKEDLMFNGKFLEMCADNAIMFPMAEMARDGHVKFIPQVLLIWNGSNDLNDHKVSQELQQQMDRWVRGLPRYEKTESPFTDDLKGTIEELKANVERARQEGAI